MTPGIIVDIIAAFWIVCGVAAYGITVAYFQRGWPPRLAKQDWLADRSVGAFAALLGPCGLAIAYYETERAKHGWML